MQASLSTRSAAPTAQDFLQVLRGLAPLFTAELAAVSVDTERFGTVTREEFPALLARVERSAAVAAARAALDGAVDPYTGEAVVVALPSVAQLRADDAERAHLAAQAAEYQQELMYGADARLATALLREGR